MDYYALLGVFRDASQEEIKRAYFEAAQKLHPDKNTAAGETEIFLEVQKAYETLANPKRRNLYDATLPPEIANYSVITQETLFSRPNLVRMDEPQMMYAFLEISPREGTKKIPAPPLNICLALDRSTSMQGEKLDVVKATAIQILRSLRPEDVFSVVAFSDRAEVVVPAGMNAEIKKQENQIQMMTAFGGTEIYSGLAAAMEQTRRTLTPGRIHHIILLTDGNTYGDEQSCLELADEAAAQNIGISGMGIGHEWNDIFLDALAGKTGGSSAYIAQPKDIQHLLVEKFNTLVSIYADDVILECKETDGVKLNYAFRLQPELGALEPSPLVHLGPILRDTPLHVILEFIVQPSALGEKTAELMRGSLKPIISARPLPAQPLRFNLSRPVRAQSSDETPPRKLISALSRLTLYRLQDRARAAADSGDYDSAARSLNRMATHLLAQGETSLAKTVLLEADLLEKSKTWSGSGQKDIKYKTRALLLGGTKENLL